MDKMYNDDRNYDIPPDIVDQPEQPPVGNLIGYGLDTFKGMVRVGDIVKQQHDAGYGLHDEGYECYKTESTPESGTLWCPVLPQMPVNEFFKTYSDFNPVYEFSPHAMTP
jgi:hypothetical protein